jgi:Emfourin
MRITFKSDGGFVYLPARAEPVTIDTHDLPAEEANELERLIEAARFFDLPETSAPPRGAADYLRYTISVTDPERSHTVSFTDPIEDPHLQALVEFLETKAHEPGTTS